MLWIMSGTFNTNQAIPKNFKKKNDNCHSKGQKSSETKMTQLEDKTFVTPVCEVFTLE